MDRMTFWIAVLGLCAVLGWLVLRLLRPLLERPEDRSAIDTFSGPSLAPDSAASVGLSRHERIVVFAIGACIGGFFFCGGLHTNLSPPVRPLSPEPTLGYIYLLPTKHGVAYGTYFEHLAVTYGIWLTWGLGVVIWLIGRGFGILGTDREAATRRSKWQVLAAAIASYLLYYAIWRTFGL